MSITVTVHSVFGPESVAVGVFVGVAVGVGVIVAVGVLEEVAVRDGVSVTVTVAVRVGVGADERGGVDVDAGVSAIDDSVVPTEVDPTEGEAFVRAMLVEEGDAPLLGSLVGTAA